METPPYTPGRILIPQARIAERVRELGRQISSDYAGSDLLAVGVLRGSVVFAADLLRALEPEIRVRVDFVRAGSYGDGTTSRGEVTVGETDHLVSAGGNVLIVDDVVDTGRTLRVLQEKFRAAGPRSLRTAALLDKQAPRTDDCPIDYIGFSIPDVFVVGYGLDYAQRYRHLPDIRVLEAGPGSNVKQR